MEQFKVGDKVQVNDGSYVETDCDEQKNLHQVLFPVSDVWQITKDLGDGNVLIQNLTNPQFPAPHHGNATRAFRVSFLKKYQE